MKTITTNKLKDLIGQKEYLFLNVLPEEYYKEETLPGSKNICVYETAFGGKVQKRYPHKDTKLIVFGKDNKHHAASRAGAILESLGYTNVYVYKDGVDGWKKARGKITKGKKMSPKLSKKSYRVNTKESYLFWEGNNIHNKHYGKVGIKSGVLNVSKTKGFTGDITIDMNKISNDDIEDKTTNGYLIAHLQSADFFETKTYPTAHMEVLSVKKISDVESSLNYQVKTKVTIKSKTLPFTFKVHGHLDNGKIVAQGSFVLDRSKWWVQYGSSRFFEALGMHLVHDEINFRFKLVAS